MTGGPWPVVAAVLVVVVVTVLLLLLLGGSQALLARAGEGRRREWLARQKQALLVLKGQMLQVGQMLHACNLAFARCTYLTSANPATCSPALPKCICPPSPSRLPPPTH